MKFVACTVFYLKIGCLKDGKRVNLIIHSPNVGNGRTGFVLNQELSTDFSCGW